MKIDHKRDLKGLGLRFMQKVNFRS